MAAERRNYSICPWGYDFWPIGQLQVKGRIGISTFLNSQLTRSNGILNTNRGLLVEGGEVLPTALVVVSQLGPTWERHCDRLNQIGLIYLSILFPQINDLTLKTMLQDTQTIRYYQKLSDALGELWNRGYRFDDLRLYVDGYLAALRHANTIEPYQIHRLEEEITRYLYDTSNFESLQSQTDFY